MKKITVELIAVGIFSAFFGYLFFEALAYHSRSSYMPLAASGCGLLMCLFWGIGQVRQMNVSFDQVEAGRKDIQKFALIAVVTTIYVIAFAWVGFFTSTLVMVPVLAAALGYRNWTVMILTAVGFCAVIFVVFRLLLAIPLPKELIFTVIGV